MVSEIKFEKIYWKKQETTTDFHYKVLPGDKTKPIFIEKMAC